MALIGQIRKRGSWVLIVLIGLGLGGFIIQDMLVSGPSASMGSQPKLGSVNGEEISYQDFQRTESLVSSGGNNIFQQRNSLWDYFVENKILQQYGQKMGLDVPVEELKTLEFGPNYSPIIIQNFPNPQAPGIPDVQQLSQLKNLLETGGVDNAIAQGQLNRNFRAIWRHQESLIIKDRLQTKLNNLVAKGMYTPTWMAEDMGSMQNQTVSFAYVKVPFDEMDNADVSLSDADYQAYLQKNAHQFEREEETRRVKYVSFNVTTTPEDSAALEASIAEEIPNFEAAENDTTFIQRAQGQFPGIFVKEEALNPVIKDAVVALEEGGVYGPYVDGAQYKAVKLMQRRVLPDSVSSRHILLRVDNTNPTSFTTANAKIDSIKAAIEAGTTTFSAMNDKYNDDVVAKEDGGDLGYAAMNAMVKPFNDVIFLEAETSKLYKVTTQFGIHLVEVLGRKFETNEASYLLGYLQADIIPSDKTQKAAYSEAFSFMTNNRTIEDLEAAAAENPNLSVETSDPFDANAYQVGFALPGTQSSRELIKWSFDGKTKVGKVSSNIYEYSDPVRYFDNRYVVVALDGIMKPGMPSVDEVRTEIQPAVANVKKGEQLMQAMQGKSLSDIASTYGTSVDTISNVNFSTSFLQDIGSEPKVVGEAFKLEQGQTSAPIVGNTGVYLVQITSKLPPANATANVPQLRQQLNSTSRAAVASQLMSAIKDNAKVKDNRATFY